MREQKGETEHYAAAAAGLCQAELGETHLAIGAHRLQEEGASLPFSVPPFLTHRAKPTELLFPRPLLFQFKEGDAHCDRSTVALLRVSVPTVESFQTVS